MMRTRRRLLATTAATASLCLMLTAGLADAQSPTAPADPHRPTETAADQAEPGRGAPAQDGMMRMMETCRLMATPMMGVGGERAMDTKTMSQMLQMRGEIMKAIGEIMMKHSSMMMQDGAAK
jgi:hypothetical protein